MPMPSVFISYSWDSDEHKAWVDQLGRELADNGVQVSLDQWDLVPGASVTQFMEEGVRECDFVLAICTPSYARKANDRSGGAGYEQQIVSGELLSGTPKSKFIPVIAAGEPHGPEGCLPTSFAGALYIDFRHSVDRRHATEQLLRAIYRSPETPRPEPGRPPSFVSGAASIDGDPSITVVLDDDGRLDVDHAELFVYDVNALMRSDLTPKIEVFFPGYSDAKKALAAHQDLEPERRLQLTRTVELQRTYGGLPKDEAIAESLEVFSRYVLGKIYASSPDDAARVVTEIVDLWNQVGTGGGARIKFDVISRDTSESFAIWLSAGLVEEIEKREGVQRMHLTAAYGLNLLDLRAETITEIVYPRMIMDYCRQTMSDRSIELQPESFFELGSWRLGLG